MIARSLAVGVAILSLVSAAGCAKRLIPGTEIEDTDDTQAILALFKQYRIAMEGRDADSVVKLTSADFKDDGGTVETEDDLDRATLQTALLSRFSKINNVRLNLEVRGINIKEADATAVYYYTLRFETPGLSSKVQSNSDLKKMELKKDDAGWKILSGI